MVKTYETEHLKVQNSIYSYAKDCCFLPINNDLCKAAVSLVTELKCAIFSQVVCVSFPVKMPIFHNVIDWSMTSEYN